MSDDLRNDDIIDFDSIEDDEGNPDFASYKRDFDREKAKRARKMKKVRKRLVIIAAAVLAIVLIIGFRDQLSFSNLRLTFSNIGAFLSGEDINTINFKW